MRYQSGETDEANCSWLHQSHHCGYGKHTYSLPSQDVSVPMHFPALSDAQAPILLTYSYFNHIIDNQPHAPLIVG